MTKALHDSRNGVSREMVQFLEQWAPYGGGDDEIFTTFGVFPTVFYSRLAHSLRADPTMAVADDVEKLIAYCIRRAGTSRDPHGR